MVWSDISLCVCVSVSFFARWLMDLIAWPGIKPGPLHSSLDHQGISLVLLICFPVDWWYWASFHVLMWMNIFLDPFSTFNLVVFLLSSCRLLFFNVSVFPIKTDIFLYKHISKSGNWNIDSVIPLIFLATSTFRTLSLEGISHIIRPKVEAITVLSHPSVQLAIGMWLLLHEPGQDGGWEGARRAEGTSLRQQFLGVLFTAPDPIVRSTCGYKVSSEAVLWHLTPWLLKLSLWPS